MDDTCHFVIVIVKVGKLWRSRTYRHARQLLALQIEGARCDTGASAVAEAEMDNGLETYKSSSPTFNEYQWWGAGNRSGCSARPDLVNILVDDIHLIKKE